MFKLGWEEMIDRKYIQHFIIWRCLPLQVVFIFICGDQTELLSFQTSVFYPIFIPLVLIWSLVNIWPVFAYEFHVFYLISGIFSNLKDSEIAEIFQTSSNKWKIYVVKNICHPWVRPIWPQQYCKCASNACGHFLLRECIIISWSQPWEFYN